MKIANQCGQNKSKQGHIKAVERPAERGSKERSACSGRGPTEPSSVSGIWAFGGCETVASAAWRFEPQAVSRGQFEPYFGRKSNFLAVLMDKRVAASRAGIPAAHSIGRGGQDQYRLD